MLLLWLPDSQAMGRSLCCAPCPSAALLSALHAAQACMVRGAEGVLECALLLCCRAELGFGRLCRLPAAGVPGCLWTGVREGHSSGGGLGLPVLRPRAPANVPAKAQRAALRHGCCSEVHDSRVQSHMVAGTTCRNTARGRLWLVMHASARKRCHRRPDVDGRWCFL